MYPRGKSGQMLPFPAVLPRACRAQGSPALHSALPQPQHHAEDTELLRVEAPQLPLCTAPDPPPFFPSTRAGTHCMALVQFSAFCAPVAVKRRAEWFAEPEQRHSPIQHTRHKAALPFEVIRFSP